MNKSILMSIQPKWVCEILNGNKTIEVRKKFPKDYVGWVYIYCTLGNNKNILIDNRDTDGKFQLCWVFKKDQDELRKFIVNGKVVARFWCDKIEEIYDCMDTERYETDSSYMNEYNLQKDSCLTDDEIADYLKGKDGYAIHISKLEIFDKPKELSEFDRPCQHWDNEHQCYSSDLVCCAKSCKFYKNTKLVKAPQSWCYIAEVNEND